MMIQNGNAMTVITDGVQEMSECPKCGGTDIALILFGFPPDSEFLKEEIKKKKIVLGGCIVSKNDPQLECNDCLHRWGTRDEDGDE